MSPSHTPNQSVRQALKIEHLRKQKDFETLIPNDVFYRDSARAEKQENLSGFLKIM